MDSVLILGWVQHNSSAFLGVSFQGAFSGPKSWPKNPSENGAQKKKVRERHRRHDEAGVVFSTRCRPFDARRLICLSRRCS